MVFIQTCRRVTHLVEFGAHELTKQLTLFIVTKQPHTQHGLYPNLHKKRHMSDRIRGETNEQSNPFTLSVSREQKLIKTHPRSVGTHTTTIPFQAAPPYFIHCCKLVWLRHSICVAKSETTNCSIIQNSRQKVVKKQKQELRWRKIGPPQIYHNSLHEDMTRHTHHILDPLHRGNTTPLTCASVSAS